MRRPSYLQILLVTCLIWTCVQAAEENRTDTEVPEPAPVPAAAEEEEEAEFRQGIVSGYPAVYGGGSQYMSGGGSGSNGYVNMLRNLYRPPSFGLTDKVKHWVKSFMNRRQYVKPYYGPAGLQQYSPDEFGGNKPVFLAGGNSYKAISVPLRQLQKYYKPYYPEQQQGSASAALLSYGLYAPSGTGLYTANNGAGNSVFSAASSNPGQLFAGTNDNLFSQGEGGTASALFSAYGTSGGQGTYQQPSSGSMYSLDSSSIYGASDGGQSFYGASSSGGSASPDLYASGANPVASIYNPQGKKVSDYSDQRKETSGFGVDSSRSNNNNNGAPSSSYSQFQGSSSGFQPVSFAS